MKKNWGIILLISCMLCSCDAMLFLSYRVQNKTTVPVALSIKNYGSTGPYGNEGRDTTLLLKPGQSVIVCLSSPKIGFPGDEKLIFEKQPGVRNFKIAKGDSLLNIDAQDQYWTYASGTSTFRITKKNLPQDY